MRVLISGAGVAGPAMAWWVAKTGARITVVEKSAALLSAGQNIDVNGSALALIRKMGLMDELKRLNTTEQGTQMIHGNGEPFASFPLQKGGVSPTSENEILRGDLAIMLYEATKNLSNVDYVFGTTVEEVLSNDKMAVTVRLSSGETQEYDLLVAADGQWSRIRKQCFPPEVVTVVDKDMYCAYATVPQVPSDDKMWNVYHALGSRIVTSRPDPHGTHRTAFMRMPCNDVQRKEWQTAARGTQKEQKALLRKDFADAGWQAKRFLDAMETADDFYFQAVQQIRMSQWSIGRVICLGDAAYAPTPLTGAGANLAIDGAYVLAGELSKLDEGEHPERALKAYEAAFRPFVEETQDIPSFLPSVAMPSTALKRWLLRTVLWTVSRIVAVPFVQRRLGGDQEAEDFPLPKYALFEGRSLEKMGNA